MNPSSIYYLRMQGPLGTLLLTSTGAALTGVYLPEQEGVPPLPPGAREGHPLLDQARRELDEYFARRRRRFEVPLAPAGTPFQRAVWAALTEIPYGATTSYGSLAARLGRPLATRAVGAANGRNPISILIPCHRVVGGDGALRGYAGGVSCKRWLLQHERCSQLSAA